MNNLTISKSLDGGAISFASGSVLPWDYAPVPDTRFPVIMGLGLPGQNLPTGIHFASYMTIDRPHQEVLRFENGNLWLRGELFKNRDPALFGAARAWLVACTRQDPRYANFDPWRMRYTTGGGEAGGNPGPIVFAAHREAPEIRFERDGCKVGGLDASRQEVHDGLCAWFLGPGWEDR